jgi:ATP-dependent RNA helicase RhlE
VCSEEKHYLADIQKLIKLEIPQEIVAGFDPDPDFFETGPRHRGRRSSGASASASMPAEPRQKAPAAPRTTPATGESRGGRNGSAGRGRQRSNIAPDGFDFSKPYEPANRPEATAEPGNAGETVAPRRPQRPIAVLLGGLGRK